VNKKQVFATLSTTTRGLATSVGLAENPLFQENTLHVIYLNFTGKNSTERRAKR
jgi:hypothetical protein